MHGLEKKLFYLLATVGCISCSTARNPSFSNLTPKVNMDSSSDNVISCVESKINHSFNELQQSFNIKSKKKIPSRKYTSIDEPYNAYYNFDNTIIIDTLKNKGECLFIIDHEMTHRMLDLIGKQLGYKHWPDYSSNPDYITLKDKGMKIVNEGIAQYVEYLKGGPTPTDITWYPDSLIYGPEDFYDYYRWGFSLVKPILDEFGPSAAWYIVWMSPDKDLIYPDYWRRRVRREIIKDPLGKMKSPLFPLELKLKIFR